MAEQYKNLAITTLDGDILAADTSLDVTSAALFPTTGTFRIRIENEIIKVTSVSSNTFTVSRAQEGTAAADHSNGEDVAHVLTVGALDARDQDDLVLRDARTNRPAAGTAGRLFLPTDSIYIHRDNGSSWDQYGPMWSFTPPTTADFGTWVNQGSATATDNKGAVWLTTPTTGSINVRGIVKAYPSPPFTVEMAYIANLNGGSSFPWVGLAVRNSGSGDIEAFGTTYESVNKVFGLTYASPTSVAAAIVGWQDTGRYMQSNSLINWVRYEDDNTNRKVSVSADGYTWVQMLSEARTTYVTPNQLGLFVQSGGSAFPIGGTFLHWRQF